MILLLPLFFLLTSHALKLDIEAQPLGLLKPRCIKDYVSSDTLVVVTAWISGSPNDGQRMNIEIGDTHGNKYGKPKNVLGESRNAFTVHEDTYISICFSNELLPHGTQGSSRHVELDIDIGADALDWSAIQKAEKLAPMETDLRRIESVLQEVVDKMDYLKLREQRLRDTNESTNERVKGFAVLGMITLIGSGIWQVFYLRRFFQRKKLI